MTTLLLACEVMREELLRVERRAPVRFEFLSMGLHVAPARLHAALQVALDAPPHADRVVLGFGLCGNAIAGLVSPHAPLIVPRVHDCIPLITGGAGLSGALGPEKGTFYLSGGWMEGERTLAVEHRRAAARFGEQKALRILQTMLDPYRRFAFVRTAHPRRTEREEEARELAGRIGLPLETVEGDPRRLERIVQGPWDGPEFVRVPRGVAVPAAAFEPRDREAAGCDEIPQGGVLASS